MKRAIPILVSLTLILGLTACGSTEPEVPFEDLTPLSDTELAHLYSSPKDYVGSRVNLVGQVFTTVDRDENGVYFQIFADPKNMDWNTYVMCAEPDFQVEQDDYVVIDGLMYDVSEGENMLGATLVLPVVDAYSMDVLSYEDAMAPTLTTATAARPTIDQHGYAVTVESVELAESETRVNLSVTNNGSDEFSLWSFNAKILQDGKQFESQLNFEANYPEVQSGILPGVTTQGVICFPAIADAPFQLIVEGYSGNYFQNFVPYTFECSTN